MISLKPIYQTKAQEKIVFDKIRDFFDELLFDYIDEVMSEKPLENDRSAIIDGLKSGKIRYIDGYFIITNRISTRLALELEALGGRYDRRVYGYKIPEKNIPVDISQAIARINISEQDKLKRINDYLKGIDEVKDYSIGHLSFDEQVNKIGTDLDGQFKQSMSKIHVVPADMNESQKEEIAKNYTNNMKLYIQKWTDQEIVKLRKDIEPFIMGGVRTGELSKVIQQHKGVSDRKAKFLARQETKLLVSQYQRNRFKQAGVTRYKWSTNLDGREREWHRKLHGQIFSWDEPPIIDERTGERGHPGDAFNCYSKDTEVLTDNGFKPIKDVCIGEKIATMNPQTRVFEWSVCTNKVKKYVDNIVTFKNNIFDLAVSQDHTFFYYKKKYDGKRIVPESDYPVFTTGISSLAKKNTIFYASSDNWKGKDTPFMFGLPTDIFCKFMGYYLSDGNVDNRKNGWIHIANCNNEPMYNELSPYMHVCRGKEKLFIKNEQLYDFVSVLGKAHEKHIPDVIKGLSTKYLRVFLDAFASCDGRGKIKTNGFNRGKDFNCFSQYYTCSPKMMADLVECIYKVGMSASVYIQKKKGKLSVFKNGTYKINHDIFIIQEVKTKNRHLETMDVKTVPYNDYVYDIEVAENHTILVKRGHSIHWNSNCRCVAIPQVDEV